MVKCIDCFEEGARKKGFLKGKQRRQCIYCGRHFTEGSGRSYSVHEKRNLARLIIDGGMTYREVMYRYKVSSSTLLNRVKLLKRGVI